MARAQYLSRLAGLAFTPLGANPVFIPLGARPSLNIARKNPFPRLRGKVAEGRKGGIKNQDSSPWRLSLAQWFIPLGANPVFIPLGANPVFTAWRKPSIYPAWHEPRFYPAWHEPSVYPAWHESSIATACRILTQKHVQKTPRPMGEGLDTQTSCAARERVGHTA